MDDFDFTDPVSTDDMSEIFGLCGCGHPDTTIKTLGDTLELLAIRHNNNSGKTNTWKEDTTAVEKRLGEFTELYWLTLYFLDHLGMTEHGGSVGGSWPSSKGEDALEKYLKWKKSNDD